MKNYNDWTLVVILFSTIILHTSACRPKRKNTLNSNEKETVAVKDTVITAESSYNRESVIKFVEWRYNIAIRNKPKKMNRKTG